MSPAEKAPLRVAVTGAAGQIGYSILPRIAAGEMLGKDQPIILQLLEIPVDAVQKALEGVAMELDDCAFPLLRGLVLTGDPNVAFKDADWCILVGSKPRGPGMERADLLKDNGAIFVGQGKAIDAVASDDARVVVVGNPCNTNCMIAAAQAKRLGPERFTAMTRLDQNRAQAQLAQKAGVALTEVDDIIIFGNHSPTMFADFTNATISGKPAAEVIGDDAWLEGEFLPTVGKRGAAIIAARGLSSAASAANAAIDHMHDWALGTGGKWVTMGVPSNGEYGIPKDVMFGFPVTTAGGEYQIVEGLAIDAFSQERINLTLKELQEEQDGVRHLL